MDATTKDPAVKSAASRSLTWPRIVALVVTVGLLTGLIYLRSSSGPETVSVPQGAHAGHLTMHPCTYPTENGGYRADCGTLVVPEDRADPRSRLIALPVIRILARSPHPLAPIFRLNGGPGQTNMKFPDAGRLAARHDVVMVGYRGVDGSSVLTCPEVTAALSSSADVLSAQSMQAYSQAFAACAHRLESEGADLAGYTLAEQADDIEAARVALGYHRIDLLSESEGTRLAMIYAWRYPSDVERSVMIGVNPPGNFLWSGTEIDQGIERYSAYCAQDPSCRSRTASLAATVRNTAAHPPGRWLFLPIHQGNVRVATFLGLADAIAGPPLTGPVTLNSWISAAHGNPSGLWFNSLLAGLSLPTVFTWGEFAAIGQADRHTAQRYFASTGDRGSIIGNPGNDFLWADGALLHAWPANPSQNQYTTVQNSSVPTLLIGGTVDFATPAENATRELLPHLRNGHQVVLSELGHSPDFWQYEPAAGTHLLTTFYDTGQVDTSLYTHHTISFKTPVTETAIAEYLLGAMLGFAVAAIGWLAWVARRVRKRGAAGRNTSIAARTVVPLVLGLGGWFAAALIVLTLWPTLSLSNEVLGIVSVSAPIALGLYLAWAHRDWDRPTKIEGLLAVCAGALLGGWFGFTATSGLVALFTTIIGAAAAGNLALMVVDLWRDPSARPAAATAPSAAGPLAPGGAVAGDGLPPGPGRSD
jgi:pimeloyl-ACP methyl ester carboxylesterase